MAEDVRHEFYLDLDSWPIVLGRLGTYEVVRTVVVAQPEGPLFKHLVQEVRR